MNRDSSGRFAKSTEIKAFKAFDKNFMCRGFQYEIGKTYKHDGEIHMCRSGFHACADPLDVLDYYPLMGSKFAEVVLHGPVARYPSGSTIAAAGICIKAEIELGDYIARCVNWTIAKCRGAKNSSSGHSSTAASCGHDSTAASSGDRSTAASSGDSSTAASSGAFSTAASSGNNSKAASSGNNSTAASSGDYSKAAISGYRSTAASSGYRSTACATGISSIAMVAGIGGAAKAGKGGAFALPWLDGDQVRIAVGVVGENVKADVLYRISDGNIVEAE